MPNALHPLAVALNTELKAAKSPLYDMLSKRGKRIYFPSKGILGQSAEAKGCAINATIGTAFEEDKSPLCLECVESTINLPSTAFLYAGSYGFPAIREQWRQMLYKKNPSLKNVPFSQPVVTHALTHGLSVAGFLFLDEGSTVILPDLYWDNYELIFSESYGAKLATYPMFKKGAFNADGLGKMLLTPGKKKILLLNFPNNPTGYTATEKDSTAIVSAIRKAARAGKEVVILLDDAYFGLVYEPGVSRESLFPRLAALPRNVLAVKLDGATKEDYVWGLRVGFITFGEKGATPAQYKALESKAAGTVRASISNASNIGQQILLKAYNDTAYGAQKTAKFGILKRRYDRIKAILDSHPEYEKSFVRMPTNSGYFMCIRPRDVDPETLRAHLLKTRGTGVIVLSGLIRIAFSAVPLDKLETLFANIHAAIQELQAAGRAR